MTDSPDVINSLCARGDYYDILSTSRCFASTSADLAQWDSLTKVQFSSSTHALAGPFDLSFPPSHRLRIAILATWYVLSTDAG